MDELITRFVVEFDGKGYYADNQPNYEWSFTPNVGDAKRYKTLEGANTRGLMIGGELSYRVVTLTERICREVKAGAWTSRAQQYQQHRMNLGPPETITLSQLKSSGAYNPDHVPTDETSVLS